MTKQTIEVPEGYKLAGDPSIKHFDSGDYCLIKVEKSSKPRRIGLELEEIIDSRYMEPDSVYYHGKWWREVKENDLSLNSDKPKVSIFA
jgi:hypothetical protein